jgi:hypothetical protein
MKIGLKATVDADSNNIVGIVSTLSEKRNCVGEDLPATESTDSDRASGAETEALRERLH